MFTKLLKHDFLQSGRLFIWQLGGCILVGGIATLLSSTKDIGFAQFGVAMLVNVLLLLLAWAAQTIGMILMIINTNRAFFSERGYLLFSLPASSEKILLSKLLCNMAWLVLNNAVSGGLVFVMMSNYRNIFRNLGDEMLSSMPSGQGAQMQESLTGLIYFPSFAAVLKFAAIMLVFLLVVYVLVMMAIIFVLTISHVRPFSNSSGLWIFLFLIIVGVGCGLIVWGGVKLLPEWRPFSLTLFALEGTDMDTKVQPNMIAGAVMLALTTALFFMTNWLLKRKISLK